MTAPSLCRVALLVGENTQIDYSLPAGVALIAVTEDLVARVNDVLGERGRTPLDAEQTYRLCRADARPLNPQKTLDECGVLDGEQLWLLPASATEVYEPVIEMVSTAVSRAAQERLATMTPNTIRVLAGWLTGATVAWSCLIVANWWITIGGWNGHFGWLAAVFGWALLAALVLLARGLANADNEQRRTGAAAVGWSALPAAAAAAATSLPGKPGMWHVAAAVAAVMAGVVVLGALWGRYRVASSAILTMGLFVFGAAVVAASPWDVRSDRVAVVVLGMVLVGVSWASSAATVASGIPTPLFPSVTNRGVYERLPGQPADTVSPVGATGVASAAQVWAWVRRGNDAMTGLLIGLAVVTVVACRYALVPNESGGWRYTAFVAASCVILVSRSRTFVDRYQSVTLIVAAAGGIAMIVGRYAADNSGSAVVALVCAAITLAVMVVCLLAALVVPYREFTAPVRRFSELIEYALVLVLLPWGLWLINLYPVIRNAVRHGI